MIVVHVLFFFFKQKTAYEMRISDWSSDVCSSDLLATALKLDISEPRHRHEINQLLRTAWEQLTPVLAGVGGTFTLRLEQKAEIEAVDRAWQCPLTRRVLPRLVFGRSPNLVGSGSKIDGKIGRAHV